MTYSPNSQSNDPSGSQSSADAKTRTPRSAPSYYQVLGLKPNASVQEIRRAYRDLSKLYHPDTTKLESAIAIPKFQALNEAYATLSSPEKRLTYDYKVGYSRISVMQPLSSQRPQNSSTATHDWSSSAYLDPNDRPLSAGELFALFILGVTFVGCLILVVTIALTKGEIGLPSLETLNSHQGLEASLNSSSAPSLEQPSVQLDSPLDEHPLPELPQTPWLIRKTPTP